MLNTNISFLEEFKHLDNLLKDIYETEKGVTEYLENMKCIPRSEYIFIHGWDADFKNLKKLRDLRNKLSHDTGTLNMPLCTQEDVEWLKNFYDRILKGCDPLTLARKEAENLQRTKNNRSGFQQKQNSEKNIEMQYTEKPKNSAFIIALACAAVIIILIMLSKYILKY
ncbi:MAG TPA: hypothetical protein IAA41_01815 [Candidatus Eubacterium faecavium]|nr:hypothetical protein [Candidatus Eubacterium faecavium]